MVVHERPGVDRAISLFDVWTKPFEKAGLVFVVSKYHCFVDPSYHDVMQGARDIQTSLAWHGASKRELVRPVKCIDTQGQDTTSLIPLLRPSSGFLLPGLRTALQPYP